MAEGKKEKEKKKLSTKENAGNEKENKYVLRIGRTERTERTDVKSTETERELINLEYRNGPSVDVF